MSNNIIKIGIPSKGRLRSGVLNIFKKKKLKIISERGERDLFGFIKGKKNIIIKIISMIRMLHLLNNIYSLFKTLLRFFISLYFFDVIKQA